MSAQAYPFEESIAAIRAQIPEHLAHPAIGIVCGSGLSTLASRFKDKHEVPYHGLPGFVESTVAGHKSAFAFGKLGEGEGVPVVAMLGRVSTPLAQMRKICWSRLIRLLQFHPYEGYPLGKATYPIRIMKKLGVKDIISACGHLGPMLYPILTLRNPVTNATGSLNPAIPVGTSKNRPLLGLT